MSWKSTRWVRRTLLGGACVLALAAVLVAAAVALLNSRFGQTRALNLVNGTIPGKIAWSALHLSPLRGRLEIRDGAVADGGGLEVLAFDRLFLDVGWKPLLRGLLRVDALELDRPRVLLRTGEAGSLNIVRAFLAPAADPVPEERDKDGGPWFPLHIAVGALRIQDGALGFVHEEGSLDVSVDGVGLGVSADTSLREAELLLTFDRLALNTPGLALHGSHATLALLVADGVGNLTMDADLLSAPLRLRATADLAEALPRGWLEPVFHARALAYQATVTQEGLELGDLLDGERGLSGRFGLNVTAAGKGVDPEEATAWVDLDLSVSGLRRAGHETAMDARARAEAHLSEGVARLIRLEAGAGGLALSASGSYGLAAGSILADVRLEAPDLAPLLPLAGIPDAQGSLVLRADASGTLEAAEAAVSLEARGVGFSGVRLGDLSLAAALDSGGTVSVSSLRIANRQSLVEGGGSMRLERAEGEDGDRGPVRGPMNFRASLRAVRPQDFLTEETASGTVDGEVVLSGAVQAPEAAVRLAARDLHVRSVRIGDLDARAGLSRGTVTVDALEVRNGASRLSVTGRAQVLEPDGFGLLEAPVLDLNLEGDPIALEDFSAALEGNLSLSARVEGSPGAPLGRLILIGRDLTAGGQKIHSLDLEARAEGDRVVAENLEVVLAPGESLTGTGWVSLEKAYGVSLRSAGISIGSLAWVPEPESAQGLVTLELSGEGTFAAPRLEGEIGLRRLQVRGHPIKDGTLRVDIRDGSAGVVGNLGFPLEGRYGLDTGDFAVSVDLPDVDLAPYLALAGRGEMRGRLAGRLEAMGNSATPLEARGFLALSRVELIAGGTRMVHGEGVRVEAGDGAFSVLSCELAVLEEGRLAISGGGRLDGPLAVEARGEVPLQVLSLFTDELPDIRGRLGFEARVAGSVARPEVHADLEIAGVSFTVPGLYQSVHGLSGRARLTPKALELEALKGMLDTGTFRMDGRAELDGFQISRVDAALKADRLPLEVPETLDARVDLDLRLEGTQASSSVRGRCLLLDGVYYRDVNLSYLRLAREATRRRRAVAPPPREIDNPFLRNMTLDILVQRRAPFRVENDLADLAVEPDLRIIGAVNHPVVTGSARVSSGSITFQKHEFQVTRGTIDFLNPHRTEPTIDIRSEGRIKTWTVFLELTGTPDELEFVLSSVPPEGQGDIVSLLLFGRTTRQLIEGEGGSTLTTRQQLAELIGATYGEDIRRATGLDYFKLAAVDDADGVSDAIRVTLGRDITRRLRLLSSMEIGDGELVTRVSSEYKLLEHFLVGAFQDTRGKFGGELIFRLEFR